MENNENLKLIEKYGKNGQDSGTSEVQIAILTNRIQKLSGHLKDNKKDYHSYYGLMKLVNRRKRVVKYLKGQDVSRYQKIIESLNLRK